MEKNNETINKFELKKFLIFCNYNFLENKKFENIQAFCSFLHDS